MNWFKRILKLIMGLVLILGITMLGIFLFVDPNQFKKPLEQQVLNHTGHTLSLKGPLTWTWSPLLALAAENVQLDTPTPMNTPLIAAESLRLEFSVISLFTGKIGLSVNLKGLQLYLKRNTQGETNWASLVRNLTKAPQTDLQQPQTQRQQVSTSNPATGSSSTFEKKALPTQPLAASSRFTVLFTTLQIEESKIVWEDQQKNTHYQLEQVYFSSGNVMKAAMGVSNPVVLKFGLSDKKESLGNIEFSGHWSLEAQGDRLTLSHIALLLKPREGEATHVMGDLKVEQLKTNPKLQAKVESKNVNLHSWGQTLGLHSAQLPKAALLKTTIHYLAPYLTFNDLVLQSSETGNLQGNFKLDARKFLPKTLDLTGDFQGHNIALGKIKIDSLQGKVVAQEGVIKIMPVQAKLANSQQALKITLDFRNVTPRYTLEQEGQDFEIKHLLALFNLQDTLEGNTRLKTVLTTSGNTPAEWRSNVSGSSEIELQDGKFYGINLISLLQNLQSNTYTIASSVTQKKSLNIGSALQSVQALWDQKKTLNTAAAYTPFHALKANSTISNGIITTSELSLLHPEYQVSGQGNLNLSTEALQYQVSVLLKNNPYTPTDRIGNYLYTVPLSIKIDGSLAKLSIHPDFQTYTNNVISFAQKEIAADLIEKNVQKAVTKTLGKYLEKPSEQPSDQDSTPPDSTPQKKIEKELHKTVEKALTDILGIKK